MSGMRAYWWQDYEGQKLAERIFHLLLIACSILGFFVGLVTQQLSHSVYILGAGVVLSSLVGGGKACACLQPLLLVICVGLGMNSVFANVLWFTYAFPYTFRCASGTLCSVFLKLPLLFFAVAFLVFQGHLIHHDARYACRLGPFIADKIWSGFLWTRSQRRPKARANERARRGERCWLVVVDGCCARV